MECDIPSKKDGPQQHLTTDISSKVQSVKWLWQQRVRQELGDDEKDNTFDVVGDDGNIGVAAA